jgi:cytochrome c5
LLSRDKRFFDSYSVVVGTVLAALVVVALAVNMLDMGQDMDADEAAEYQAAVASRIRPLSQVYLPGEETEPSRPTVETAVEPEPVATAMTGPQVYNTACLACHGAGIAGAPIFGDAAAWAPRIAKGISTLNDHALNGFTDVGYMPPKGGRIDLSDAEILDAVAYMVAEVR